MRQILQSLKTGETILEEVPSPNVEYGQVLIKTTRSLISLGTERMLVEFGKASIIKKARQQPDKVKMVLDKIRSDGLMPTLETVFNKLEQPLPLGYCNVGKVVEVGKGVTEFKIGDRVASNGPHAEFVSIPQNLVAHIPDSISDEEAAFTVIGSIGLQGIRLIMPTIGETIVVVGLGLIGLLTAEMLISNGCQVIGYDLDGKKVKIAQEKGIYAFNPAEGIDPVKTVMSLTNNIGADGVIITASAKGDKIISQTAQMSRKRGRIVLVGVIDLNISRADFYEKELSFQVSCSYGPGRYDENYEQGGIDYPLPFVRWTEKRNFETVLNAIATGNLEVNSLISEVVPLESFNEIYGNIEKRTSIASIIKYDDTKPNKTIILNKKSYHKSKGVIGIIGAGNFTKMTLLPALKDTTADIKCIVSSGGVNGTVLARKYNISQSSTDYFEVLNDSDIDSVIITTLHNSHAKMVIDALNSKKHVFVEKPLALNHEELESIIKAYSESGGSLMVGFNRRFSPHIRKIKQLLGSIDNPVNIMATMNAGFIPSNVWVHDLSIGGGRIIGEACHYIDLLIYLTGSKVTAVCMNAMGKSPAENTDNASILLRFENGSNGVINYFANGSKIYSKERVEIFSQERTLILDNFKTTKGYGFKGFNRMKTKLDKGHKFQFENYLSSLKESGAALIPFDEIINTTKTSFAAIESLKQDKWIDVD